MSNIDIIVPVYKVGKYLNRCIDSIISQTYTNYRLILVDDGSPDNCGKICDEYAKKDKRIHVIHQENGGLSAARNAGIDWAFANSDSEWLTFIDSDDWIHQKYLESLYGAVEETKLDVAICGYVKIDDRELDVNTNHLYPEIWNTEEFFCSHRTNSVVAWAKIYKKYLFEEIRYPVGKIHEDSFTTHKILFKSEKIAFVDEPMYAYYMNAEGICRSTWTPKHLIDSVAMKEQITFFAENGYKKAEKCARLYLIIFYADSINKMIKEQEDYSDLIKDIRTKLKKALRKKDYQDIPDNKYKLVYSMAYPKLFLIHKKVKKKYSNFISLLNEHNFIINKGR